MSVKKDYLKEDRDFKGQKYVFLSLLKNMDKNKNIIGLKIKGFCKKKSDIKNIIDVFVSQDNKHNIFVCEVGKWVPITIDDSLDNQDNFVEEGGIVYQNENINKLFNKPLEEKLKIDKIMNDLNELAKSKEEKDELLIKEFNERVSKSANKVNEIPLDDIPPIVKKINPLPVLEENDDEKILNMADDIIKEINES